MGALAALSSPTPELGGPTAGEWVSPTVAQDWGAEVHVLVARAGGDPLSVDPRTLREAQAAPDWPEWERAIAVEMANLCMHGMYELVERPLGAHVIGCMLVFYRK